MRSRGVVMIALVGLVASCREAEPIERLGAPNDPAPVVAPAQPVPIPLPPPPPPPPEPGPMPPPVEIVAFLREAAGATEPWRVTIHELADRPSGPRFRGYQIVKSRVLEAAVAEELIARLARETSYTDGDVGCVGIAKGIALARGGKTLELVEDCGHVYLTERGHDGRWALFSPEMATFVRGLGD